MIILVKDKELEKQATEFLKENGYGWDGRRKEEVCKTIFLKPQTGIERPPAYYK